MVLLALKLRLSDDDKLIHAKYEVKHPPVGASDEQTMLNQYSSPYRQYQAKA